MVDPASMLTVAKAGYDAAKKAIEIADRMGDVELKAAILELKEKLLAQKEENFQLKEKVSELEKRQKSQGSLVFERNLWWEVDGDNKIGPYCSACYGDKEKLVRMATSDEYWMCPVCKHLEQHTKSSPIRISRARRDEGWESV